MEMVRRWTGRESRALRQAMRLSVRDFSARLGVAARTVTKWEAEGVDANLRPDSHALLDTTYHQTDGQVQARFVGLLAEDTVGQVNENAPSDHRRPKRAVPVGRTVEAGAHARPALPAFSGRERSYDAEDDDVRRRRLLELAALGAAGTTSPFVALETARHSLTLALAHQRAEAAADEWQEIVTQYGYRYLTAAPADLLDSLIADVLGIQYAIDHQHDGRGSEAVLRELRRAGALLAVFMAMTVANLGQVHHAERWWRSARRIAQHSGDVETVTWVRGREVQRALYERRPLGMVLRLADEAEAGAKGAPLRALPDLVNGKAEALVRAGRADEARAALHRLQDVYAALPSEATADGATTFAWPEFKLHNAESSVYSQLGDVKQAAVAQDRALAAYPPANRRGLAQIELQRAQCLVRSRDVTEGVRHAQTVMAALSPADCIRPIFGQSYHVLEAIPVEQRANAAAAELRDYLTMLDTSS